MAEPNPTMTCPRTVTPPATGRHRVAVGTIRRNAGRTTTLIATSAGVTGRITPAGGAR